MAPKTWTLTKTLHQKRHALGFCGFTDSQLKAIQMNQHKSDGFSRMMLTSLDMLCIRIRCSLRHVITRVTGVSQRVCCARAAFPIAEACAFALASLGSEVSLNVLGVVNLSNAWGDVANPQKASIHKVVFFSAFLTLVFCSQTLRQRGWIVPTKLDS